MSRDAGSMKRIGRAGVRGVTGGLSISYQIRRGMKKTLKILAWVVGLLVVLAVVIAVGGGMLAARFGAGDDAVLEVWLEAVEAGELIETLSAPGQVRAITEVEISARVSARVVALPHGEGSRVTAGDPAADPPVLPSVLIELDASDLRAQLDSAEKRRDSLAASIEVDRARIRGLKATQESVQSALDEAHRNLERQTELQRTGDVSDRVFEETRQAHASAVAASVSAEANLRAAQLGLEVGGFNTASAEADIQRLRDNLAYTTITSPIDGIVTRVNVEAGEIAVTGTMNNPGTVLLEVADLSGLVVVARVDESDINRIEPGQVSHVRISAYPDEVFEGTVERVALSTSQEIAAGSRSSSGAAYFEARVRLDELPDPIRTGLSATVEIEAATFNHVLLVPNQSVVSVPVESLPEAEAEDADADNEKGGSEDGDETGARTYNVGGRTTALAVYTVRDGKATLVPVEIGASDNDHTVITAGLEAGDRVISGPFSTLSQLTHDVEVNVTRDAESGTDTDTDTEDSEINSGGDSGVDSGGNSGGDASD